MHDLMLGEGGGAQKNARAEREERAKDREKEMRMSKTNMKVKARIMAGTYFVLITGMVRTPLIKYKIKNIYLKGVTINKYMLQIGFNN